MYPKSMLYINYPQKEDSKCEDYSFSGNRCTNFMYKLYLNTELLANKMSLKSML